MSVREYSLEMVTCLFAVATLAYVWEMDLKEVQSLTGSRVAEKKYESFDEFYPFYLTQHVDETCKLLHFAGTSLMLFWVLGMNITSAHKSVATFAAAIAAGLVTVPLTVGVENALYEAVALIVTSAVMCMLLNHSASVLVIGSIIGYSFAWIGHFFYEKNKPATFTYITYSLVGDFHMYYGMLQEYSRLYLKQ